jgi:sugar/nucleoside kinase (ribokinase family)
VIQASAAAAMKATKPGGRAGIPVLASLQEFIKTNPDVSPQKVE